MEFKLVSKIKKTEKWVRERKKLEKLSFTLKIIQHVIIYLKRITFFFYEHKNLNTVFEKFENAKKKIKIKSSWILLTKNVFEQFSSPNRY